MKLEAIKAIPEGATSAIIFAHGSGSGRLSPRNQYVAKRLNDAGFATLLVDLLTREEDQIYQTRFDIDLLNDRLILAINMLKDDPAASKLKIGLFGASTGAAAALKAAVKPSVHVEAIVSRGGRPDLAGAALSRVTAPTLLIVGGADTQVLELNQLAFNALSCEKELSIVPNATHLFEESGALEFVATLAVNWFKRYL